MTSTASLEEIRAYLDQHPDLGTLEILSPDMNGILRAKRIPRAEIETYALEDANRALIALKREPVRGAKVLVV